MITFHCGKPRNPIELVTLDKRLIITDKNGKTIPVDQRRAPVVQVLKLRWWLGISIWTGVRPIFIGYQRWEKV